jgi:hypothetical protein
VWSFRALFHDEAALTVYIISIGDALGVSSAHGFSLTRSEYRLDPYQIRTFEVSHPRLDRCKSVQKAITRTYDIVPLMTIKEYPFFLIVLHGTTQPEPRVTCVV